MKLLAAHQRLVLLVATVLAIGAGGGTLALFTAQSTTGNTNFSTDALNKHFQVTPGAAVQPSTSTPVASGNVDTLTMDFGTAQTGETFTDVFKVKNVTSGSRTAELTTTSLPSQIASMTFASSGTNKVTLAAGAEALVTVVTAATTGTGTGSVKLGLENKSFPTRTYPIEIETVAGGGGAPAAPTSAVLANGGGVGNAYINAANEGGVNVNVAVPASSGADTVHVEITDGTNETTEHTAPAPAAGGTVALNGIDTTGLVDGSLTIRAWTENASGPSSVVTASVTKDTVKPSSQVQTVASITSGNTFTTPYTSGDTSPSSSLQKVELYVDTPGHPETFSLTSTDSDPSASGESFSYTGATTDGDYRFYSRAYDNAGNVEDAPDTPDQSATRTVTGFRMATGSYTGTGMDNRALAGLGFQPDVVIVKGAGQVAVMKTRTMTGDATKVLVGSTAPSADRIQSLDPNGFTLGANAQVNGSATAYHWIAFKEAPGFLKVGSYNGTTPASSRAITEAVFQPEYAAVLPGSTTQAFHRFAGMSGAFPFANGSSNANRITGLDPNGFSVGTEGNTGGTTTYHYVLFNDVPGSLKAGEYDGANTASQEITGVGFKPDYVMIRGDGTGSNDGGQHRPASLGDPASLFYSTTANATSGITELTNDGFDVGGIDEVNKQNTNHYYLAFKNTAGGSSLFSTLAATNNGDSWIEQADVNKNNGADSNLKVTAKSPSNNTRALVRFTLPATPSGMSLKHSSLYLRDTSSASGRTIQAFGAAASWTEGNGSSGSGVTWANQPGTTGTAATAQTVNADGYLAWTVTSLVSAMYPPGSNNGFILRDQNELTPSDSGSFEQQFSSEEAGSNPPRLDITFGN